MSAVELFPGRYLSFAEAARLFPPGRQGRPVAPATLWRWARRGVRLADGSRLRLRVVRIGGRFAVSEDALREFIERQQPADASEAAEAVKVRTEGQKRRSSERADARLAAAGW